MGDPVNWWHSPPGERTAHCPGGWTPVGLVAQAELESPDQSSWLAHDRSLFMLPGQASVSLSGKWRRR